MKKPFTNPTPIHGCLCCMSRNTHHCLECKQLHESDDEREKTNLQALIAGIPDLDLRKYALAGEDFINDSMKISIYDLPNWIKNKARTTLNMSKKELRILIDLLDIVRINTLLR